MARKTKQQAQETRQHIIDMLRFSPALRLPLVTPVQENAEYSQAT